MRSTQKSFRGIWLNLPLRLKGMIVTAIPIFALLAFSAAFFAVLQQYKSAGLLVRHTLDVLGALQRVRTTLIEEDAAVKGYALTRDANDLEPYRAAVPKLEETLRQLRGFLRESPGQTAHLKTLQALLSERRSSMASFLAADSDASRIRWLSQNKATMHRIDAELGAMFQVFREAVGKQTALVNRALRAATITVIASAVVGLGGGVLAMLLFAAGIVRRITRLQEKASDLARGNTPALEVSGNDEIGRLAEALHTTAGLIHQQRASVQHHAKLLQCILDSMGDGVIVADESGRLILSNPAAERIFAEAGIQYLPERWSDGSGVYLPDKVTPCPSEQMPLMRAIRGEPAARVELFLRNPDADRGIWIDVTARPLREDDVVRGGVSVFRDVSLAKHNEETLRLARREAERANLAKSEFLSRMSHELRTPLNAILGFAQLLELDAPNARQRQSVEQILKGGEHLLRLINEVLDLARIEAGRLALSTEPILVGEAVQSAINLVSPLAVQSGIRLHLEASGNWKRYVLADRQRFQQVVLNLLSNAIKYNSAQGMVNISCQTVENLLHLAIRDTGSGLPPEKVRQLFKPFERLGAEQTGIEGTGIGLTLSKGLVEAMGGRIGVDTRVGDGSTFWVELPMCDGPLETYEEFCGGNGHQALALPEGGKKTRLLYIEDNLSNNLLMQRILENRPDTQLISAMQGRLGIDLARQHRPDLIFLDLHLPDMNGNEVLRNLRHDPLTAEIPVAMISADATPGQIDRLLAAGAQEYFTKPLDVKKLLQFVDETLGVGA